jgi:glutamyl-tRNA synthetase
MERLERLGDAPGLVDFLFLPAGVGPEIDDDGWAKAAKPEWAGPLLADVTEAYSSLGPDEWRTDTLKATMEALMLPYEIKLGKAQALPRVAVTGRAVGPPLFEALEVLGQNETVRRLRAALTRLASPPETD